MRHDETTTTTIVNFDTAQYTWGIDDRGALYANIEGTDHRTLIRLGPKAP